MKKSLLASCFFAAGLILSACGGNPPSTNPGGNSDPESKNFFNEINEKMEIVSKVMGTICSSESESRAMKRGVEEDLFYMYGVDKVESFVNVQQQLDYIITIIGFIENHLSNADYGTSFNYDVVYEGEAYMKTISTLNDVLIQNNLPTPKLKVKFSKDGNDLVVKTSWDYRNDFMDQYSPIWSLDILSSLRFVFGEEQEIQQIWVNYNFADSVNFNCAIGLFDFENAKYESVLFNNSGDKNARYPENDKQRIEQNIAAINAGTVNHENIIRCSNISVSRTKLGADISVDDFEEAYFYISGTVVQDDISSYNNYTYPSSDKEVFDALFDEVYSDLYQFSLLTQYEASETVNVTPLFTDAAVYSFWKAVFVYDTRIKDTILPFIEYNDLLAIMDKLISQSEGATQEEMQALRNVIAGTESKYTGNEYKVGDNLYEIWLDENVHSFYEGSANLIEFYCDQDFHYILKKNGTKILTFDANGIYTA